MGLCSYEPLVIIIKPGDFSVCYHHVTPQMVPQLVEGYVRGDDPCLDLALGTVAGGGEEAGLHSRTRAVQAPGDGCCCATAATTRRWR